MTKPTLRHATARVIRTVDDANRVIRFAFSDGSVDRMGDTINPDGWDVTAYKRNPVVPFAHDTNSPPIGRTINGPWSDGNALIGDVQFAPPEIYEFADTIYKLVKAGYLKAGSVGFQPLEYRRSDDPDRPGGLDFIRQELLEFSIVPVPANANALVQAAAKGLLSRKELARFRDAAGTAPAGNCGRPIGSECGMKDVADCTIHGQGGAGIGDPGTEARMARIRRAAEVAQRVGGISRIRLTDGRADTAYISKAEVAEQVALLRARHGLKRIDPRIVAARSAFRFGLS